MKIQNKSLKNRAREGYESLEFPIYVDGYITNTERIKLIKKPESIVIDDSSRRLNPFVVILSIIIGTIGILSVIYYARGSGARKKAESIEVTSTQNARASKS